MNKVFSCVDGQEVCSYTIIPSPQFEVALAVKILRCCNENLTKSIEAGLSSFTLGKNGIPKATRGFFPEWQKKGGIRPFGRVPFNQSQSTLPTC